MNPNLAWEEAQAKLADYRRVAERRHMEGEAHRACNVCGLPNSPAAQHCEHCGARFAVQGALWNWPTGP